jgi:hypothetical protein
VNAAIAAHPNLQNKSKAHQKLYLRDSMFAGKNLWVFKPSDYNRGRGVNIVSSIEQLRKLISDYTIGVEV